MIFCLPAALLQSSRHRASVQAPPPEMTIHPVCCWPLSTQPLPRNAPRSQTTTSLKLEPPPKGSLWPMTSSQRGKDLALCLSWDDSEMPPQLPASQREHLKFNCNHTTSLFLSSHLDLSHFLTGVFHKNTSHEPEWNFSIFFNFQRTQCKAVGIRCGPR